MVSGDPNIFIDTSRIDMHKYATRPSLCKALFRVRMPSSIA